MSVRSRSFSATGELVQDNTAADTNTASNRQHFLIPDVSETSSNWQFSESLQSDVSNNDLTSRQMWNRKRIVCLLRTYSSMVSCHRTNNFWNKFVSHHFIIIGLSWTWDINSILIFAKVGAENMIIPIFFVVVVAIPLITKFWKKKSRYLCQIWITSPFITFTRKELMKNRVWTDSLKTSFQPHNI